MLQIKKNDVYSLSSLYLLRVSVWGIDLISSGSQGVRKKKNCYTRLFYLVKAFYPPCPSVGVWGGFQGWGRIQQGQEHSVQASLFGICGAVRWSWLSTSDTSWGLHLGSLCWRVCAMPWVLTTGCPLPWWRWRCPRWWCGQSSRLLCIPPRWNGRVQCIPAHLAFE